MNFLIFANNLQETNDIGLPQGMVSLSACTPFVQLIPLGQCCNILHIQKKQ